MQLLKASSSEVANMEADSAFQRHIVEGKKELLQATTEQYGNRNRLSWEPTFMVSSD